MAGNVQELLLRVLLGNTICIGLPLVVGAVAQDHGANTPISKRFTGVRDIGLDKVYFSKVLERSTGVLIEEPVDYPASVADVEEDR